MADELQRAVREWLEEQEHAGIPAGKRKVPGKLDDLLWNVLTELQRKPFLTTKRLVFYYEIRGYEMFVSRKDKSITRSSVMLSFHRALELQAEGKPVSGPKKLGTFGASYLYPIFQEIGVLPHPLTRKRGAE